MRRDQAYLCILLLLCGAGHAQELPSVDSLAQRYSKGSITTLEIAERALAESGALRARLNQQLHTQQQECYQRFFTNACLDEAREQHRAGFIQVRQIELEASRFKRRTRAEAREQAAQSKYGGSAAVEKPNAEALRLPIGERGQ